MKPTENDIDVHCSFGETTRIKQQRINLHHNKIMESIRKDSRFRIIDTRLMKRSGDTIIFDVD